jgi:hypothetical protein
MIGNVRASLRFVSSTSLFCYPSLIFFTTERLQRKAIYVSGFEISALFDLRHEAGQYLNLHAGLWVESVAEGAKWPESTPGKVTVVVVEGVFVNRLSGHMRQYFGRLEKANFESNAAI